MALDDFLQLLLRRFQFLLVVFVRVGDRRQVVLGVVETGQINLSACRFCILELVVDVRNVLVDRGPDYAVTNAIISARDADNSVIQDLRRRYQAAVGLGAQREAGSDWRSARHFEASVTSPPISRDWHVKAAVLHSSAPVITIFFICQGPPSKRSWSSDVR